MCDEKPDNVEAAQESKLKFMISQPMRGYTEEEIKAVRDLIKAALESKGLEFVNSLFDDEWAKAEKMQKNGIKQIPVYFLAKSLEQMARCDYVVFAHGWNQNRGCRVEHEVAKEYGLHILYAFGSKKNPGEVIIETEDHGVFIRELTE